MLKKLVIFLSIALVVISFACSKSENIEPEESVEQSRSIEENQDTEQPETNFNQNSDEPDNNETLESTEDVESTVEDNSSTADEEFTADEAREEILSDREEFSFNNDEQYYFISGSEVCHCSESCSYIANSNNKEEITGSEAMEMELRPCCRCCRPREENQSQEDDMQ